MENPKRILTVHTKAIGGGLAVYDERRQVSYVLNATSALVWQHCDGRTSQEQLTALIQRQFNVPSQKAERLLSATLNELGKTHLLESRGASQPLLSRRQMLGGPVAAGLTLALMPVVSPVTVHAGEGDVFPTLQCVTDNGDGTYTAHFGYINYSSEAVTISVEEDLSKNMFTSVPKDRGRPSVFLPGVHENVFSVVFDGAKITWLIKEDKVARQQVSADAFSPSCPAPPTTAPPTTQPPTQPPTTTVP
jgi:hypothetical protein